jgi:DNA polymerase-3 subunit epsilon
MDFVAIDVETANPDMASICQVGIAGFEDGAVALEWETYVDPQDWFSPMNVSIHGIDEMTVAEAPTFPDIVPSLLEQLTGAVVACHTAFDRVAMHQAFAAYELDLPPLTWLDTARVARRAWARCAHRGYGLADVCEIIDYDFRQHDALEDAKAAGQILLAASSATGLSVQEWLKRVELTLDGLSRTDDRKRQKMLVAQDGDPEGPLAGEVIVFTGALQLPRREAATQAACIGCQVADAVTKKTTLLVVGDQDVTRLAGHDRSSKHRKAEDLIARGQPLRILRESDFMRLVELEG